MHLKHPDLILVVTIALMNIGWVLLPNYLPIIGVVLALPLVFVLPGYALTEALFHSRSLDNIYRHRFILFLGLSLTIDILSGFTLNLFPWGLQALSWALCLGVLTVAFSLVAVYRRSRFLMTGTQLPKFPMLKFPIGMPRYVLIGLCLIAAVTAIALSMQLSIISAAQQPRLGFTQLWILPSSQDNQCAVLLGVRSFEATPVTYRVVMTINDIQVSTWSAVNLVPQEQWHQSVKIYSEVTGTVYVEVKLYRLDKSVSVYRDVHLLLNIQKRFENREIHC